ncbi:WG repeat-containing protein [Massilia atriviolacea]|uniref:WG repeat-containing protein n=1 Tax=Massilia atriviolacea TaxID=2495579 RepID=A0A430HFP7_9BURK|nr:WG repeat-containing protein [Massilia atriviolacea]RSZ56331.1 WG repeat-containing protein [Massilia atriviolacea]
MPTHPILIRNHLQAGAGPREVLLIHAGRVVPTSPALRYVGHFRDDDKGGLIAPAWTIGGGCGYIDASGRWVVAPELDDTRVFNEGLARYCKDGLWGFMRLDGTPAIRPRWSNVQPFHNGLAAVLVAPDTWRYIDQSGAYAFNGEFTLATPFGANGLAAARIGARDKTGYLNRSGDWAIAPRFDNALRFFADRAAPASVAAHQYGLIDASGEWIVQPDYRYIDEFNADGLAFFGRGKESWSCDTGFMDTSGQTCFHGAWSGRDNMVDGMLRDSESTWLTRHGKVYFDGMDWGGEFNAHGFAIGRNSHYGERVEGQPNPPATWGILRTDGECFAAPGNALEPLTDGDGMFDQAETNTPLAVFIGNDDDLLMLDRDARIAFRLRRESCADGQYAALYDDKARLLWTSAVGGPIDLPAPFFVAPPHTLMDKLPSLDGLIDFAKTMLADTERKLHRFAREGEIEDDGDNSEVDDADDDDDEYDDDEDAALGRRLSARSRIVRFYVNEELVGYYSFLAEERSNVLFRIKQDCVERLSAHFGAQDNEPDFAGRPDQTWFHAWPVSLETPLPGAADTSEANRLWLALNWSGDTGDGDEWGDLWLTCAPSLGTLERALQAFDSLCGDGDGEDQVAASAIPLTLQERIPCARISSLP